MANTNAAVRVGLQLWIAPAGKYTIISGSGGEQTSTTVTINSENYPDMSNEGQQKIWRKIQSCISCEPNAEVTTVEAQAPSGNGSILTPYAKEVVSSTRTLTLTLQSFDDFIAEVAFRMLVDPVTRQFKMDSEPMKEGWLYLTGINRYGKIISAISGYCSFEASNVTLGVEDFVKPTLTATMLQSGKTLVNLFDPNMIITPSASTPGFDIFKTGLASDTTNNWRKSVANLTNMNDAVADSNATISSVSVFGVTGPQLRNISISLNRLQAMEKLTLEELAQFPTGNQYEAAANGKTTLRNKILEHVYIFKADGVFDSGWTAVRESIRDGLSFTLDTPLTSEEIESIPNDTGLLQSILNERHLIIEPPQIGDLQFTTFQYSLQNIVEIE